MTVSEECGDICAIESTINGQRVLLVTVYISPGTSISDIEDFFELNLLAYTPKVAEIVNVVKKRQYHTIPILLSGDINLDLKKPENHRLIYFMEETFGLQLKINPTLSTTRGGSCIDLIFARHIDKIDTKSYISYFSYHKPLLSIT